MNRTLANSISCYAFKHVTGEPEAWAIRRSLFKVGAGAVAATILGSATYKYLHQGAAIQLDKLGIKLPKALNPLPTPPADPAL
jgi:hypothetical protein